MRSYLDFEKPVAELESKIEELRGLSAAGDSAAIGEEMGLLGTSAVLIAFLLMIGAGLRIALRADAPFDKLLAAGLTTILGVQSFIIIGGVIRLVPLTGITLPFVSYGGSSLLANYVLLALLVRISTSEENAAVASDPTTVG